MTIFNHDTKFSKKSVSKLLTGSGTKGVNANKSKSDNAEKVHQIRLENKWGPDVHRQVVVEDTETGQRSRLDYVVPSGMQDVKTGMADLTKNQRVADQASKNGTLKVTGPRAEMIPNTWVNTPDGITKKRY
jgi:hypothetical protein